MLHFVVGKFRPPIPHNVLKTTRNKIPRFHMLSKNGLKFKDQIKILNSKSSLWAILASTVQAGSTAVVSMLVAYTLTPNDLGLFYTFLNILAIQVMFELGFSTCIIPFLSHECNNLDLDKRNRINDPDSGPILDLLNYAIKRYEKIALIAGLCIGCGGILFLKTSREFVSEGIIPWISLVIANSGMILANGHLSTLEGLNNVEWVVKVRLLGSLARSITLAIALFSGLGLHSLPLSIYAQAIVTLVSINRNWKSLFAAAKQKGQNNKKISRDIFGLQWKMALSFLSGYAIFNLYVPIIFKRLGPEVAGRFGLSWTITLGVVGVAYSWVAVNTSKFGILISQNDYHQLNRLWWSATKLSFLTLGFLYLGFLGAIIFLPSFKMNAEKLLPTSELLVMLVVGIIQLTSLTQAAYLRSHKKEPFLIQNIVGAVLVVSVCTTLEKDYGLKGIIYGMLLVFGFGLPINTAIFYTCRKNWQTTERG